MAKQLFFSAKTCFFTVMIDCNISIAMRRQWEAYNKGTYIYIYILWSSYFFNRHEAYSMMILIKMKIIFIMIMISYCSLSFSQKGIILIYI